MNAGALLIPPAPTRAPSDRAMAPCTVGDCDPFAAGAVVPFPGLRIADVSLRHDGIAKRQLRAESAAHAAWLHECYRAAASRDVHDEGPGVIHVTFIVQPGGTTTPPTATPDVEQGSDPFLLSCIERAFTGLLFFIPGAPQGADFELRVQRNCRPHRTRDEAAER